MTQDDLGRRVGVTRQAISSFESGAKSPDPETFVSLASALQQPHAFFTNEDRPIFGKFGSRFFRKTGPETIRGNDACLVLGHWFVQAVRYLDDFVNYPPVDLPSAVTANPDSRYSPDEIEEVAANCRKQWGLGLGPITNVLALLESKGIAMCRYEIEGIRFDAAHELAHLILHRWVEQSELADPKTLKRIEAEADRFAGAFLLPKKSFPNEVYTARLDAFLDLKRRWSVSIQAMIYRCKDLGLIDDDQFTNLYKQISYRKWRTKEPLDDPKVIRIEQPKLLQRAASMVLESGKKHPDEMCAEIALDPRMIATFWNLPLERLSPPPPNISGPSLR
jgi:transcriptional regulator with XRE-family HTH domain